MATQCHSRRRNYILPPMPSNPQVPREVAEAKGKGAVRLAVLGISLAAIGLAAVLVGVSGASSSSGAGTPAQAVAPAQMLPAGVESQPASNYPLCADARDLAVTEERPTAVIQLREDCWSGRLSGFPEAAISRRDDRDIEFLLENGSRKLYHGPEKIETSNAFAWARARGTGELKLWIHGYASLLPSGDVEAVPTEGVVKYVKRGGLMEPGRVTIEPSRGGERTYVVGVFAFVYRTGHYSEYLDGLRVGDYARLKLARDNQAGMFVERIDVVDNIDERRPTSSAGSATQVEVNARGPSQTRDGEAIPLLLEATVREKSSDGLRLRVNDTGVEVEVRNVRDVPVYYRGATYRIRDLEIGDEVRLAYFPTTQEVGEPSNITRPVKIEVLRSMTQ
jgi:hypothetical protein